MQIPSICFNVVWSIIWFWEYIHKLNEILTKRKKKFKYYIRKLNKNRWVNKQILDYFKYYYTLGLFPPCCQLDWSDAWFAWVLLIGFELEFPKLKSKLWSPALLAGSAAYIYNVSNNKTNQTSIRKKEINWSYNIISWIHNYTKYTRIIKLVVIYAWIKIGDCLFTIAFYCCFVISPIIKKFISYILSKK